MEKYVNGEFSLRRAAEFTGVSVQQMARYMAERGIPFFKYRIAEAERDTREAESRLRDAYSR